jgi:hypothetical protein
MSVKEELTKILKEHQKLKGEISMKRYREQNEVPKDTQAEPSSANTPLEANDTEMKPDAPQNEKEIQESNEATQDTQADVPEPAKVSDGTPMKPDASQNEKEIQEGVEEEPKTEQADDEEEPGEAGEEPKEEPLEENENGEEDKSLEEKYSEMEDDMTKVVDVIESLKSSVDDLNKKVAEMESKLEQMGGDEDEETEEPMEPVTESAILKAALVESVGSGKQTETVGKAMSNFLKKGY